MSAVRTRIALGHVCCVLVCLVACGQTSTGNGTPQAASGGDGQSGGGGATGGATRVGGSTSSGGASVGGGSGERATFPCGDGTTLSAEQVCDGQTDCLDGVDEWACPVWYCDDGARIVGWALCDGRPHCP